MRDGDDIKGRFLMFVAICRQWSFKLAKMFAKLLCLALVALFCLKFTSGAPANNVPSSKESLVEQFAEFLHQDKEFSEAFARGDLNVKGLIRNKRASEQYDLNVEDLSEQEDPEDQGPGFFDRAAKFVIELLQRFLKWVNSD